MLRIKDFSFPRTYSILNVAMKKRKTEIFQPEKVVKAIARERIGQPKPSRVLNTEPKQGRQAKHKPKMEEVLREGE